MAGLNNLYSTAQALLLIVAGVLVLVLGGKAVIDGALTIGGLLGFYIALSVLSRQLNTVFGEIPRIIDGNEALSGVFELLTTEARRPYSGSERIDFDGEVELRNVTFGYGQSIVLSDISLSIRPGRTLGISGPNGSGKTSIIYLILGLYRPTEGVVLANNKQYELIDLDSVIERVGVVLQDPMLFNGTIRENILYGSTGISEEAVDRAAHLSTAHHFIHSLPAGYDTEIGEAGLKLSGGQRQRIAITRALVKSPRLLILDEPTNHLDIAGVRELLFNLGRLADKPAIVLVSHSAEVLALADDIVELQILSGRDGN
jgi:ABC-type bacteriocin/lantibiotic exporter with double-glycine peptidase domain